MEAENISKCRWYSSKVGRKFHLPTYFVFRNAGGCHLRFTSLAGNDGIFALNTSLIMVRFSSAEVAISINNSWIHYHHGDSHHIRNLTWLRIWLLWPSYIVDSSIGLFFGLVSPFSCLKRYLGNTLPIPFGHYFARNEYSFLSNTRHCSADGVIGIDWTGRLGNLCEMPRLQYALLLSNP